MRADKCSNMLMSNPSDVLPINEWLKYELARQTSELYVCYSNDRSCFFRSLLFLFDSVFN